MAALVKGQYVGSSPLECWVCMEQKVQSLARQVNEKRYQKSTKAQTNGNNQLTLHKPKCEKLKCKKIESMPTPMATIYEKEEADEKVEEEENEKERVKENVVNLEGKSGATSIVCRGCKMQRYCCLNHMTQDQCQHREICAILTELQTRQQVAHPLLILGPKAISSITQLQRTIGQLKLAARIKLRRPLTWREHELIGYPSYCQVCFRLDELHTCGGCGAVAYCSQSHRKSDVNKHSPEVCRTLALLYSPYRRLGDANKRNIDVSLDVMADQVLQLRLEESHLIEAFAKVTGLVVDDKPWSTIQDYEHFASCSSFSGMASICLALRHISFSAQPQDTCTVYVVGASDEQILRYFQAMHMKFFFLLHKDICQLDLCFIGSQQKLVKHKSRETICFEFQGHKRTIRIHFYPMTFKRFACIHKVDPVLIIMFDIDLGGLYTIRERIIGKMQPQQTIKSKPYDWRQCLAEMLCVYGVPICFTSLTKALNQCNYAAILELAQRRNILVNRCHRGDLNENPYREILPQRNQYPEDSETVIYANNYLEVIFTGLKY